MENTAPWLSRKIEKSITANPLGLGSKKISSLELLIKTESAFSVLLGDSSIKLLHLATHIFSDVNDFRPGEVLSPKHFFNDSTALQMIIERRWGNQIRCPDCQSRKIYLLGKLQLGGAVAGESAASSRLKCGRLQCSKVFSPFSRTRLASCRLAPALVIKAVYLAVTCSRARHYTIEKYAAEVGIASKTARRLVALLDQFPDSATEHPISQASAETPAEDTGRNHPAVEK